ncbi:MAG: hypothetical protein IJC88_01910 [Oscillospiraceae bacterium]|nr:hypothetical protein [Oscillospiraceae bacterium]
MNELVLLQETRVVGRLCAEEIGACLKLIAECHVDLDGIWRAYLVCEEQDWRIGVLEPNENGVFYACKQVPKTKIPCFAACHGVIRPGRSGNSLGWVACHAPQMIFRDRALRAAMQNAIGVLVDRIECPSRVAVPLKNGCACAPALCLAHMMRYQGEEYAVLHVDENGNPLSKWEQKTQDDV